MNKNLLNLTGALALIGAMAAAQPAMAAGVDGDWKIDGSINNMTIAITCTLKEADHKVTGECKGDGFPNLPLTGETDGKTVSWSYQVNYQGQTFGVDYKGTLESATAMKGTIGVMGADSGTFTGKKL